MPKFDIEPAIATGRSCAILSRASRASSTARRLSSLPSDFAADLRAGGFMQVVATDLTKEIELFVANRVTTWRRDSAKHTRDYGVGAYTALETLYAVIARLFGNGSLGCVRLVAVRS